MYFTNIGFIKSLKQLHYYSLVSLDFVTVGCQYKWALINYQLIGVLLLTSGIGIRIWVNKYLHVFYGL